ncbi:MAG TPA: tetratricopeptide repeat protein [Terriglobia bacterium]|nr:tetratricopeptide repeat protein [Terriglobia bacterium]
MGQAYSGLGKNEKARDAYQKAVQLEPAQKTVVEALLKELER